MSQRTIVLSGSHGSATFDELGYAIPDPDEINDYSDIARIDVAEWKHTYPGEDPADNNHDILDWGTWDHDDHYDPPCYGWREEREHLLRIEQADSDRIDAELDESIAEHERGTKTIPDVQF